jgi:hypothetical protein
MKVIEIKAKDRQIFRVGEAEGLEREFSVAFPLSVVAELEDKLGRPMRSPSDWLRIQTKEVRDILEAGFSYYHPEAAKGVADLICLTLDPEGIESVIDALCFAACPKAMARLQEEMDKARERAKKGLAALPNVPCAGVL